MSIFDASGLLFLPFGDLVQKFQNLIGGDSFDAPFSEILVESGEERLVRLNRIFFVNLTCGTPAILYLLL